MAMNSGATWTASDLGFLMLLGLVLLSAVAWAVTVSVVANRPGAVAAKAGGDGPRITTRWLVVGAFLFPGLAFAVCLVVTLARGALP